MLATGGSACQTIDRIKSKGVQSNQIILVTLISAPEGIARLKQEHPEVKLITLVTDSGLNAQKFIVPGLGDFGDRYFGTEI